MAGGQHGYIGGRSLMRFVFVGVVLRDLYLSKRRRVIKYTPIIPM